MSLILVVRHKWFDKIASGEKKAEFRSCGPYWDKRLAKTYNYLEFRRGYVKTPWIRFKYEPPTRLESGINTDLAIDRPCWVLPLNKEIARS